MCKKIIFTFLVFTFVFWVQNVFWACEYSQEIKECFEANKNDSTREINDFVCLAKKWNPEYYSYQIILDKRFQEIDEKIETYIQNLEDNKSYYFGPDKQESFIDGVNNINNVFTDEGEFAKQYKFVCKNLPQKLLECKEDESLKDVYFGKNDSVKITDIVSYNPDESSDCIKLAEQKLDIYKQVSYDMLYLNKSAVSTDSLKLYQQEQRTKYDKLLSKFMINLWYVERIWAKWPAKIKHTSG